jgi:HEAT repeat protein
LSLLGPEALEALAPVRSLAHDTQDAAIRSAALATIKSISCADGLTTDDPAIRVASAAMIGRLGWRATPAVPALIDRLTDSETKVRYAAVSALRSLGDVSEAAVARLATALAREPDAVVRAAIVGAVEALAPGTPPVLEAHVNALRELPGRHRHHPPAPLKPRERADLPPVLAGPDKRGDWLILARFP